GVGGCVAALAEVDDARLVLVGEVVQLAFEQDRLLAALVGLAVDHVVLLRAQVDLLGLLLAPLADAVAHVFLGEHAVALDAVDALDDLLAVAQHFGLRERRARLGGLGLRLRLGLLRLGLGLGLRLRLLHLGLGHHRLGLRLRLLHLGLGLGLRLRRFGLGLGLRLGLRDRGVG